MIDLRKCALPSSITVDGRDFSIKTDFHFWINFSIKLQEGIQELKEYDFIYDSFVPLNRQAGFDELIKWAFPKHELPRPSSKHNNVIAYDWLLDSDLIYSAFFQQYGIDLCDEKLNLHWYKFMALFNSLKGTKLDDVIGYRFYDGKELEYKKLKSQWMIYPKLTIKEEKIINDFRSHLKC